MRNRALVFAAVAVVACATGSVVTEDAGGGSDATANDVVTSDVIQPSKDGGCPSPTIKCAGDASVCVNVTNDPSNCGQCGTVCAGPDAGPEGGNGNPDSGVPMPDGGFDAGTGWQFPSGSCSNSKCSLGCGGAQLCSDNLCWDTQNAHDHCGTCTTACATDVEWCTRGHCCATGTDYCGSQCVNTNTDSTNCGGCGNVCPTNLPACVNGKCSQQVAITTVCNKSNPNGIFCSGNCSMNHAQYADAYCKLAGYTKAVNYTVLTSGSVTCLYYNTQNTVPTTCAEILGPTTYGLASYCDAIQSLTCQ